MTEDIKEKIPIYKKWWFWLIIVVVILIAIASQGENTNTQTSTNIPDTTTNSAKHTTVEKKEVTVADFSQMTKVEIQNWCNTNNIDCDINEEYSDTVVKGSFISQSVEANSKIHEGEEVIIVYSLGKQPTLGEKNALKTAHSYLNTMPFSYTGLIDQLEFEGYSKEEATYGVENCGADWNEQAAKMAKQYINTMAFSRSGLIEQLKFEGFTAEQAEYGVVSVGY